MGPKKPKDDKNQTKTRPSVKTQKEAPDTSSSTPSTPGVSEDEEAPDTSSSTPSTPGVSEDEQADHLHCFKVKFGSEGYAYTIDCRHPGTVLQVIKSYLFKELTEKIETPEESIVIRMGEGEDSSIVATHFPCFWVEKECCLTITPSKKPVEKKQAFFPRKNYSLFFIDKEGGKDTKTKTDQIFNNNNIKEEFRYYCVYGEKGMTVREALRLDGRFVDGLTEFTLSDKTDNLTKCTEIVDGLNKRKFQICLRRKGSN